MMKDIAKEDLFYHDSIFRYKDEIFVDLVNFKNQYKISNYGRILSVRRKIFDIKWRIIPEIIRTPQIYNGYHYVGLTKKGKQFNKRISRLVALTFLPNPNNLPQVNHKDGNKLNNNINNLEWCTSSYNIRHSFKIGLSSQLGSKNAASKLDEGKVKEIKKLLATKMVTNRSIAEQYNVRETAISEIKANRNWKHVKI